MTAKPDTNTIFTHQCIYKINIMQITSKSNCFVCFGLRFFVPVDNFSILSGQFSWVEPILSNSEEVSSSRTQHRAPSEIQTHDLAITSPALYQPS